MTAGQIRQAGFAHVAFVVVIVVFTTIAVGTFAITRPNSSPENGSPLVAEISQIQEADVAPTQEPLPSPTETPTATPLATKSPATASPQATKKCSGPIITDLFTRPEDGKVTRTKYLNTFKDPETTATYSFSDIPTIDPLLDYLNEELLACVLIRGSESINASRVNYSVVDNDALISSTKIHEASLGFEGVNVCHRLPKTAGFHKVTFNFNNDRSFCEPNFDNNAASFSYTMKGDTSGPQFEISGPHDFGFHETCLWPGYLSDDTTEKQSIKLEHYMDNELKPQHNTGGLCVKGNAGDEHTYKVRAQDKDGNTTEKSKTFRII